MPRSTSPIQPPATTASAQSLVDTQAIQYDNAQSLSAPQTAQARANIGLGNVDNTSDANKPVSTAQQEAIDDAVAALTTAEFLHGGCSTVPTLATDADVPFDTVFVALGSGISLNTSTGAITLAANATYSLFVDTGSTANLILRWYNQTAAAYIATYGTQSYGAASPVAAAVTVGSTPIVVSCRAVYSTGAIGANDVYGDRRATFYIRAESINTPEATVVAANSIFGNNTGGGGTGQSLTIAQTKTMLNLAGSNTGDQTSIVGITGTKAQFDAAVTDGNLAYSGDAPTAHAASHAAAGGDPLTLSQSQITGLTTDLAAKAPVLLDVVTVSGNLTISSSHNGKLIKWDGAGTFTINAPTAGDNCVLFNDGASAVAWTTSQTIKGAGSDTKIAAGGTISISYLASGVVHITGKTTT